MYVLGIDPGKRGALAVVSKEGVCEVVKMPETSVEVLRELERIREEYRPLLAVVEKQGYRPGQKGINALLIRYGELRGFLMALGIRFEEVSPQKWKKGMGVMVGKNAGKKELKNKAIEKAGELFPDVQIGRNDGKAEALLIAEYGRRFILK